MLSKSQSTVSPIAPSALVTGASKGIGRAIAVKLAQMGYNVALLARSKQLLQETRQLCHKINPKVETLVLACDLSDIKELEQALDICCNRFGSLHVVVNNAGVGNSNHVDAASMDHWDKMIDVNLRAMARIIHYCVPFLKKSIEMEQKLKIQRSNNIGAYSVGIINIGSVASQLYKVRPAMSMYTGTKFAALGLTHGIFEDLRDYGIKVSCIMPGYTDTEMVRNIPIVKKLFDYDRMMTPQDCAFAVEYVLKCSSRCCPVQIFLESQLNPAKL